MTWFPEVTRPCPVADRLGSVLRGNDCRHCGKSVHDLDTMTEAQRRQLMRNTAEELCVRYARPMAKAVMATLALGGGTVALAELAPPGDASAAAATSAGGRTTPISSVVVQPADGENGGEMEIIVGGARRIPRGYEYVESTAAEDRRETKAAERATAREQRRLAARVRRATMASTPTI